MIDRKISLDAAFSAMMLLVGQGKRSDKKIDLVLRAMEGFNQGTLEKVRLTTRSFRLVEEMEEFGEAVYSTKLDKRQADALSISCDELSFVSIRTMGILKLHGIERIGHLVQLTAANLSGLHQVGEKRISDIERALVIHDLFLGMCVSSEIRKEYPLPQNDVFGGSYPWAR